MRPMLLVEIWLPVPGLPDHYRVSNLGRLKSLPYVDARGWSRKEIIHQISNAEVSLTYCGKRHWHPLGALILLAFVGGPFPGQRLCRHLDDDRGNNRLENLAWGTDADNIADAMRNGYSFVTCGHRGKKHSKVTRKKISEKGKGRKISEAHRRALRKGYYANLPVGGYGHG